MRLSCTHHRAAHFPIASPERAVCLRHDVMLSGRRFSPRPYHNRARIHRLSPRSSLLAQQQQQGSPATTASEKPAEKPTEHVMEGADRPVTFALNGGPGASSVFLNFGAIGFSRSLDLFMKH